MATVRTKAKSARANIRRVRRPSSPARISNASEKRIVAMVKTIAAIIRTSLIVPVRSGGDLKRISLLLIGY